MTDYIPRYGSWLRWLASCLGNTAGHVLAMIVCLNLELPHYVLGWRRLGDTAACCVLPFMVARGSDKGNASPVVRIMTRWIASTVVPLQETLAKHISTRKSHACLCFASRTAQNLCLLIVVYSKCCLPMYTSRLPAV